jgi:hypothetical protein
LPRAATSDLAEIIGLFKRLREGNRQPAAEIFKRYPETLMCEP